MAQSFAQILEDFSYLDEWEDRYRHVIELGKTLSPLHEALKTPATKVSGCASQVWIHSTARQTDKGTALSLVGDSDALIVKGLMAIVFAMFAPLSAREIVEHDAAGELAKLGLAEHLTPQRSNGLASMVKRIKADAAAALNRQRM
jgi:cysteine desulfuration protein SufE